MGLLHWEDETKLIFGCAGMLQAHASALHLHAVLGVKVVPYPPLSSGVITFWAVLLQIFESRRERNNLKHALEKASHLPSVSRH